MSAEEGVKLSDCAQECDFQDSKLPARILPWWFSMSRAVTNASIGPLKGAKASKAAGESILAGAVNVDELRTAGKGADKRKLDATVAALRTIEVCFLIVDSSILCLEAEGYSYADGLSLPASLVDLFTTKSAVAGSSPEMEGLFRSVALKSAVSASAVVTIGHFLGLANPAILSKRYCKEGFNDFRVNVDDTTDRNSKFSEGEYFHKALLKGPASPDSDIGSAGLQMLQDFDFL